MRAVQTALGVPFVAGEQWARPGRGAKREFRPRSSSSKGRTPGKKPSQNPRVCELKSVSTGLTNGGRVGRVLDTGAYHRRHCGGRSQDVSKEVPRMQSANVPQRPPAAQNRIWFLNLRVARCQANVARPAETPPPWLACGNRAVPLAVCVGITSGTVPHPCCTIHGRGGTGVSGSYHGEGGLKSAAGTSELCTQHNKQRGDVRQRYNRKAVTMAASQKRRQVERDIGGVPNRMPGPCVLLDGLLAPSPRYKR